MEENSRVVCTNADVLGLPKKARSRSRARCLFGNDHSGGSGGGTHAYNVPFLFAIAVCAARGDGEPCSLTEATFFPATCVFFVGLIDVY